jgi:predicted negative regulator of RcsB-dependent stress response
MNDVNNLKLIEVGVIVAALGLFAWWQLRDVKRAQQKSADAREKLAREQQSEGQAGADNQKQ